MGKPTICIYARTKTQISFAVTAKLISAFVFATRIVQFLFYLNQKFQASSSFRFVSDLFGNHIVGFPTRWLISSGGGIHKQFSGTPYTWNDMNKHCTQFGGQLYKFSTVEEGQSSLSLIRPNQLFWTKQLGNKDFPDFSKSFCNLVFV